MRITPYAHSPIHLQPAILRHYKPRPSPLAGTYLPPGKNRGKTCRKNPGTYHIQGPFPSNQVPARTLAPRQRRKKRAYQVCTLYIWHLTLVAARHQQCNLPSIEVSWSHPALSGSLRYFFYEESTCWNTFLQRQTNRKKTGKKKERKGKLVRGGVVLCPRTRIRSDLENISFSHPSPKETPPVYACHLASFGHVKRSCHMQKRSLSSPHPSTGVVLQRTYFSG